MIRALSSVARTAMLVGTGVLAAGLGVGVSGCAGFDKALGQEQLVVQFRDGTSQAARLQARSGCSHIPQTHVMPLPKDKLLVDQLYDVRYQIGDASDGDVARLETCLQRFPSVAGFESEGAGGT